MKVFLMPNWYSYSNINAYKANVFSGTLDYVKGEIEKENTQELQPYTITFECRVWDSLEIKGLDL